MYYWHGQIKEDKMDGTCGSCGVRRNAYRLLMGGKLNERDHLENLDVDGRISMFFDLTEIRLEIVKWIYLVEDRNKLHGCCNSVTNILVKCIVGNFLTI
jgi:hypothetical protein